MRVVVSFVEDTILVFRRASTSDRSPQRVRYVVWANTTHNPSRRALFGGPPPSVVIWPEPRDPRDERPFDNVERQRLRWRAATGILHVVYFAGHGGERLAWLQGLSGFALSLKDDRAHLAFTYPEEGFPFYCDCAMILRESERSRLAHQFLDYLLRPKVAAAAAEYTRVATANGVAKTFLLEPTRNNPTLYPPPEIYERGEWPQSLPPAAQRLRDRIWTEIKSS